MVISGGGAGIGRDLTRAYAEAGAAKIATLKRREDVLKATKQDIGAHKEEVAISIHQTDVTELTAVQWVASDIGSW